MIEDIADYLILSNDMRQYLRLDPPPESERAERLKQNLEGFLTFQLMSKIISNRYPSPALTVIPFRWASRFTATKNHGTGSQTSTKAGSCGAVPILQPAVGMEK